MLREGEGEGEGASHNASVKACGEKRASKRETIKL